MAIATYSALSNAIYARLDVATADLSAVISDIVLTSELRLMREVRTPDMEAALAATVTAGVATVPADYVEMKYAYVNTTPTQLLQMVSPQQIYHSYPARSGSGIPLMMARDGTQFIFGPYPASDYVITGVYYKHLTAVQTSANALFVANPDLYLFAGCAEAADYLGMRQQAAYYEQKYSFVKEIVNGEAMKGNYSTGLTVRTA